jgi:hypothetical protein
MPFLVPYCDRSWRGLCVELGPSAHVTPGSAPSIIVDTVSSRSLHSRPAVRLSAQPLRTISLQLVTPSIGCSLLIPQDPTVACFFPVGEVRSCRWHAMCCTLSRFCNAACTQCIGGPGQTLSACNRKRTVELLYTAARGCCLLYQGDDEIAQCSRFGLPPPRSASARCTSCELACGSGR